MADPFSLATGVISLVVITLNVIAGASMMLDKTIAAHRAAGEELERLRGNLEVLQERMERNHGRLEALASDTKDRGFKKVLQSDAGQAAVMRLCKALKETQHTLKQLADQTESEEATLQANVPSKKLSLAFVLAVLKYNVSPQTIDEMISDMRKMQTEIQNRLRSLDTSFNDVYNSYDFFHRQLARFSTYSRLSTSTTLTTRVRLVSWLEKFGGSGSSKRSRNESRVLQTFFQADQDGDEPHTAPLPQDTSSTEAGRLLDAEVNPAPPVGEGELNGSLHEEIQEAMEKYSGRESPRTDVSSLECQVGWYRARARFAYTASLDDPNEISFAKGDLLDISDTMGKWWQARKADGTTGIAPSGYLQLL